MSETLLSLALALCIACVACDTFCQNQPQGAFVSNPNDCSQYYQCVNGTGIIKQCQDDYLWKDENKWCDFPYNVDCGDRHNPHPPPQSVCSGLDGVFKADPDDCSKYFQCAKGYAIHKKCDGNFLWNDVNKWCDTPINVNCGGNGNTTDPILPSGCPAVDGPTDVLLPNPADCSTFFKCYKGTPVLHKCPPGQLWNDATKYCDYPQNVQCSKKSRDSLVNDDSEEVCGKHPDLVFTEAHYDCAMYYNCTNGIGSLEQCPGDFLWQAERKFCDFPYEVKCGERHNSHPPPQSRCSGLDGVQLNDPDDCSMYYECIQGYAVHKQCFFFFNVRFLWNDLNKMCDSADNVQCEDKPPVGPYCPENGDELLPNPSDCGSFYQCFAGRLTLLKCPAHLHWNDKRKQCDYKISAGCRV